MTKFEKNRVDAFPQTICGQSLFSLTPCFSWVRCDGWSFEPFQWFFYFGGKPLKRLEVFALSNTPLKQGVNESCRQIANKLKLGFQRKSMSLIYLCAVSFSLFGFREALISN